jgi:SsrA-binding protein
LTEEKKSKSGYISHGIASQNRKARFDYKILSTVEAGIVLKGVEVKSLRLGRATLHEAWAGERNGELYLFNAYIPEYQGGVLSRFDVRGMRKLLVKKTERVKLFSAINREGATLVPLDIHFNPKGLAKVTLGVAEGKQKHDKRHAVAARDWQRDKARLLRNK